MSPAPHLACGNTPPNTVANLTYIQHMPGLYIDRMNNMITPPLSGPHYMSSPGLSTLPALSPSVGSPVQPVQGNRLTATPQTPMLAFQELSMPDPPLFNQSPSGFYHHNWPDLSWEEDALLPMT